MDKLKCLTDCPAACADIECHYLRELDGGRIVAVSCRGRCDGRCAGRLAAHGGDALALTPGPSPDRASRLTVRSRELCFDSDDEDVYISCAVGCVVGHDAAADDCLGTCVGLCYGKARVEEVMAPRFAGADGTAPAGA